MLDLFHTEIYHLWCFWHVYSLKAIGKSHTHPHVTFPGQPWQLCAFLWTFILNPQWRHEQYCPLSSMFAHAYIDKYTHQTLNVFISDYLFDIWRFPESIDYGILYFRSLCVVTVLSTLWNNFSVYAARILGNQIFSLILWRDYCTILWHSFKFEDLHSVLNTLTHKILNISSWLSLYLSLIVWSCDWCIQLFICFKLPYMYLLDFEYRTQGTYSKSGKLSGIYLFKYCVHCIAGLLCCCSKASETLS